MTFIFELTDILVFCYILVALLLILVLCYIIGILRDIHKITAKTRETVQLVNEYVWKPFQYSKKVYQKVEEMVEKSQEKKKK